MTSYDVTAQTPCALCERPIGDTCCDAPGFSFYWNGKAPLHHACHASQLQDEVKRLDFDLDCAKADAKNARYLLGDARAEVERLRSDLTRRCGVVDTPGSIDF